MNIKIRKIKRNKDVVNWKFFNTNFLIAFLLLILFVSIVFIFNTLPSSTYEHQENIYGVPLKVDILTEDHPFRPAIQRKVKYIVIHETANKNQQSNAKAHNEYIHKNRSREVSWHYTVDDNEIYNHLPDNEVGWHAGDKLNIDGGNANGIGIEMCVNQDGDFEKTKQNAAKLIAFLLKTHGLGLEQVKQHADFYDKNCPTNLRVADEWPKFLEMIKVELDKHK